MIKRLTLALCLGASAILAQTASNFTFVGTKHSQTDLFFTASGSYNYSRIRYVASPATCTGMTGGTVMGLEFGGGGGAGSRKVSIGGLLPSTTYNVCVEFSSDNSTWSSGGTGSVTTAALPATHPAIPVAAKTFNTNYPDTTGYNQVTLASDCSDWDAQINGDGGAVANQTRYGTIVYIPHNNTCSRNLTVTRLAPDAVAFAGTAVNAGSNSINLPGHGFTEGEVFMYSRNTYQGGGITIDPSSPDAWDGNTMLLTNYPYYVHVVDANNIQLYVKASQANGGQLVILTGSYGGGSTSNYYVHGSRPNLKTIIVRTDTPDASFVPEHVQVTPSWASKLSPVRSPLTNFGGGQSRTTVLIEFYSGDPGYAVLASNFRFVGLDISYPSYQYSSTSSDPKEGGELISTDGSNNVIFDRCWIHGQPPPGRMFTGILWNGTNQAIVDSYVNDFTMWTPVRKGFGMSNATSSQFTIGTGTYWFNPAKPTATLSSPVTVNLSGTGSGTGWSYFTMDGKLNIALPPGVTGTCSGAPCHVFTTDTSGGGVYGPTGGSFPNVSTQRNSYAVDPVFGTTSTGGTTSSIFDDNILYTVSSPDSVELGTRFTSSSSGYIRGIRFNKPRTDTSTSHVVTLWDSAGNVLARSTSSSEAASGWITVPITPVSISQNTVYTVSYQIVSSPFWTSPYMLRNRDYGSGPLTAVALYAASNNQSYGSSGGKITQDNWPLDADGRPAAAEIGVVSISSGAITGFGQNGGWTYISPEACNCMIGGTGPGPWMAVNNHIEGAGNLWHHDDTGGSIERGDYYYYRNIFKSPSYTDVTKPTWDGFRYWQRQLAEWKGGHRIHFEGNTIDTTYNDVAHNGLSMTFYNITEGTSDVDLISNEFKHVPGLFSGPSVNTALAPFRYRFKNNLAWDFNPALTIPTYLSGDDPGSGQYDPTGWIFQGGDGLEDFIVDHNTFVGQRGRLSSLLNWQTDTHSEGVQLTNNIFMVDSSTSALRLETWKGFSSGSTCASAANGEALWDCYTTNSTFKNNVMIPSTLDGSFTASWPSSSSQSSVQTAWSGTNNLKAQNYIPSSTSADAGYFSYSKGDYHLKANYCSGCGSPATDGGDVGADIDQLRATQGAVTIISAMPNDQTTATVNFIAPDSQACPVDYSSTDTSVINGFSRAADTGTGRVRNVSITGLLPSTVYYFRVNCAAQQPTGKFRTFAGTVPPPPPSTYSLSGTISGLSGAAATVTVSGIGSVQTNASGAYSISGIPAGTYTVTPSLTNYVFAPVNASVTITNANITGRNFTATQNTYSITGTVSGLGGAVATITVSGRGTVQTGLNGTYTMSGVPAGTYTITPSLTGYTFSPTSLSATITSASINSQNFTATSTATGGGSGGTTGITTPSQASAAGFNTLTFNDEFDTLDLATSANQTGHKWYPGVWFACSPQPANMTATAGVLDLKWTTNNASSTCYDTALDTTIMTHTQATSNSTSSTTNGATFKYGYFEARMKADVGNYMWPAFWLNGEYGTGGSFAELDVVEIVLADGGIHPYGTWHNWPGDQPKDGGNLISVPAGTDFSQYHTYGLLWTSTALKWYFDGQLVRTSGPTATSNSTPPLYLMLSQQVGTNWGQSAPPNGQTYNNYVDWVRVWQ